MPKKPKETPAKPATIAIILPAALGIASVGNYQPGEVYHVEHMEAERLIANKGFVAKTTDEK